jgi:hypothetical protein
METRTYTLVLDDIRTALYAWFMCIIVIGYIITKSATTVLDVHPSVLEWWWGVSNVCIVFDFPPSNYIMPGLYTILIIIFFVMTVLLFIRQKEANLAGQISNGWYYFLNYLRISECLFACAFMTIFAVSPDANSMAAGDPTSLIFHSGPFVLMVIAMTTLTLSDFIYDSYTGFASILGLKEGKGKKVPWYFYIVAIYPIVFAVISLIYICFLANPLMRPPTPLVPYWVNPEGLNATMAEHNITDLHSFPCLDNDWPNNPTCSGKFFCQNCPNMMEFTGFVDKAWTVLVLIPPLLKSLVSSIWFRDRIFKVVIPVQPHYFEDHPFVIEADVDPDYVKL